jgi:hypothetical protein
MELIKLLLDDKNLLTVPLLSLRKRYQHALNAP